MAHSAVDASFSALNEKNGFKEAIMLICDQADRLGLSRDDICSVLHDAKIEYSLIWVKDIKPSLRKNIDDE